MTARFAHSMPFGATLLPDGGTLFRLWAPSSPVVDLELQSPQACTACRMDRLDSGWHELAVGKVGAGTDYGFRVLSREAQYVSIPDPASRRNVSVHGRSTVIDPHSYHWTNEGWRGRPWPEVVLYELHVGTFTPQGTFAAAREQLPDLVALGITAIQLMPIAAFPGTRNWGYDGVLQYAPANIYGEPDDLKALIDTAHTLGLVVLLDVVYNHFGPEGNYLHVFCPQFFNVTEKTPWGAAINFDGEGSRTVRDFFIHNALFWLEEYQFDGLRLDAVHAMRDTSTCHIVCEISAALQLRAGKSRYVHIALENNANQARYLKRDTDAKPVCATAQWNDDLHHALHVITTHETDGYYADYSEHSLAQLGRSLAEGFSYQGEYSGFRSKARGEPSGQLPPIAYVGFLQSHDMVGNRAFGERISQIADPRLLRAAYVCLLLSPQIPMLFMGEEFAASTPFLYFCDFDKELARSVSEGRKREFSRFSAFTDEALKLQIPDPHEMSSWRSSQLRWEERCLPLHRERLAFVAELLALRAQYLSPKLAEMRHGGKFVVEGSVLRVWWDCRNGAQWQMLLHWGATAICTAARCEGKVIYASGVHHLSATQLQLEPGATQVSMSATRA